MRIDYSARSDGIIGIYFSIFFNMKECCVFSLESPHRGDSKENKQHAMMNIKRKLHIIIQNIIMSAAKGFFFRWDSRASSKQPW